VKRERDKQNVRDRRGPNGRLKIEVFRTSTFDLSSFSLETVSPVPLFSQVSQCEV